MVVIGNEKLFEKVKTALCFFWDIKVYDDGIDALVSVVESDHVRHRANRHGGFTPGLLPTIHAIKAGKVHLRLPIRKRSSLQVN